jgi:hypothetical protein
MALAHTARSRGRGGRPPRLADARLRPCVQIGGQVEGRLTRFAEGDYVVDKP